MRKETVIQRLTTFGNTFMRDKPSGREKRVIEAQVISCINLLQKETWATLGEKAQAEMQAIVEEAYPFSIQERGGEVPLTPEQEQAYQDLINRYRVCQKFRELIDTGIRTASSAKRSREHVTVG